MPEYETWEPLEMVRAMDEALIRGGKKIPPYHDDRGDLQEAWERGYNAALPLDAGAERIEVDERVTPRTEAGRRLLSALRAYVILIGGVSYPVDADVAEEWVAAIEAEAVAAREADLAAAVEALIEPEGRGLAGPNITSYNAALRAVLRLIRREAGTE